MRKIDRLSLVRFSVLLKDVFAELLHTFFWCHFIAYFPLKFLISPLSSLGLNSLLLYSTKKPD